MKRKLPVNHCLFSWLVEHPAWLLIVRPCQNDGITPCKKLSGAEKQRLQILKDQVGQVGAEERKKKRQRDQANSSMQAPRQRRAEVRRIVKEQGKEAARTTWRPKQLHAYSRYPTVCLLYDAPA